MGGCLGTVNNCYATENISSTGSTCAYAGVLSGDSSGSGSYSYAYYNSDATVTGTNTAIGTSMTSTGMKDSTFVTTLNTNKGDGNSSWAAVTDSYPTFAPSNTTAPTVTTQAVSDITSTTATGNGNIAALGQSDGVRHMLEHGRDAHHFGQQGRQGRRFGDRSLYRFNNGPDGRYHILRARFRHQHGGHQLRYSGKFYNFRHGADGGVYSSGVSRVRHSGSGSLRLDNADGEEFARQYGYGVYGSI